MAQNLERGYGRRARILFLVLALLGAFLILGGVGTYVYALRQWSAAQTAVKENRLDDADRSLAVCLTVWPRSVPVHLLAARAARLRGNFEQAEEHLNRCQKLRKDAMDAVQLESLLMRVQLGEEDEVAPLLLVYVEQKHAESSLILETLARSYMHNLRYGPAYTILTRWMELEPNNAEPLRWRGWVVERLNDWEGAMKDYEQALALDPNLVAVRLRVAEMLLDKANPPDALVHLERLYKDFPGRADVRARLGQCRLMQGELDEARPLLESAVEAMPEDPNLLIALGRLDMQERKPSQAEKWLRRALKVDSTNTEAEFALVACLQAQNRNAEADALLEQHRKDAKLLAHVVQLIRQEAEHPSGDPNVLYEIGSVFLNANERVGLFWLNRALQRDPNHQPSLKILAEHYESKGDKQRAAGYRQRLKPEKRS